MARPRKQPPLGDGQPLLPDVKSPLANKRKTVPNTTTHSPSGESLSPITTQIPHFVAKDYLSTDPFNVSDKITPLSQGEAEERIEKVQGQVRAVQVLIENWNLNLNLLKAEGVSLDCQKEGMRNQIKVAEIKTLGVKLRQEETKYKIEEAKLTSLEHDLSGQERQSTLNGQAWDLKIEGMEHDLEIGRKLLERKKAESYRRLEAA